MLIANSGLGNAVAIKYPSEFPANDCKTQITAIIYN